MGFKAVVAPLLPTINGSPCRVLTPVVIRNWSWALGPSRLFVIHISFDVLLVLSPPRAKSYLKQIKFNEIANR